MKNYVEQGYEQTIKIPKRKKSKNRGKSEEEMTKYKSKKLITNNFFLQNKDYNSKKIIARNNILSNFDTDFINNSLHKSPKFLSSSILKENENSNINNGIDKNNSNSQNKLNLIFCKKLFDTPKDTDSKIISFNKKIKKHRQSQVFRFSNLGVNSSKKMKLHYTHQNLKNHKEQKILISSQNLNKNIFKENENFINENSIQLNNTNSIINNRLHYVKKVNISEKINLNKLHKNKQNFDLSDEEEKEEEESNNEDIKKKYGYVSSSGSEEEETKKQEDNKNSKKKFNSKEKNYKIVNYNKNNDKILNKNHEKCKKFPINENIAKTNLFNDNINKNIGTNKKSACNIKNYKEFDDLEISQNINISNNNYFKYKHNMYISSACTLMKEAEGEQCQNEDSYLIKENIFGKNFNVYGVFDGHGEGSHKISKSIAENMGKFFSSKKNYQKFLDKIIKNTHQDNRKKVEDEIDQKDENKIPLNLYRIKKIFNEDNFLFIKNSVKYCEKKLKNKKYDIDFAGSTCVMLFLFNDKLICSNIGNSRCVLFKCTQNDKWSYINLSTEHKPENEEEKKRIIKKGGEIHPSKDENGKYEDDIQRVWLKNKQYPGLVTSRTIGDLAGKKIGVISTPTFISKKIDNRCKFIILGSDGFWDVLELSEIINIVKPYLNSENPEKVAKILVEKAKKAWTKISERDDITVIVIFISADLAAKYETNMNVMVSDGDC